MTTKRMQHIALAVALVWAGWWVFFAMADAIVTHEFWGAIVLTVVVSAAVVVAWKWPTVGGSLLVLMSVAAIGLWAPMWFRRFDFWMIVSMFAAMPLPPFAAGVLLLFSRRLRRHAGPVHA